MIPTARNTEAAAYSRLVKRMGGKIICKGVEASKFNPYDFNWKPAESISAYKTIKGNIAYINSW